MSCAARTSAAERSAPPPGASASGSTPTRPPAKRVGIGIGLVSLGTIVVGLVAPIGMFGFLAAVGLAIGIAAIVAVLPSPARPAAPPTDLPNGEMVQRFDSYLYRARAVLPATGAGRSRCH